MPDTLHVAVTGPRHPVTQRQTDALGGVLAGLAALAPVRTLHHGVCDGADKAAHLIARGHGGWRIAGHPGHGADGESPWRAWSLMDDLDECLPSRRYHPRNQDMNAATRLLVATPAYPRTDPRAAFSGTWYTIQDAQQRRHPVIFIWPDGNVEYKITVREASRG